MLPAGQDGIDLSLLIGVQLRVATKQLRSSSSNAGQSETRSRNSFNAWCLDMA